MHRFLSAVAAAFALALGIVASAQAASFLEFLPSWPITDVGREIGPEYLDGWSKNYGFSCNLPTGTGFYGIFPSKAWVKAKSIDEHGQPIKPAPVDNHPGDGCNDFDMTLYNGLLCAAGVETGCTAIATAQGQDGRFYRSPRRRWWAESSRYNDKCNRGKSEFERDPRLTDTDSPLITLDPGSADDIWDATCNHSLSPDSNLGVLLYVTKNQLRGSYQRWADWLNVNAPTTVRCPDKGTTNIQGNCSQFIWPRVCLNDRADLSRGPIGSCAVRPQDAFDYEVVAAAIGADNGKNLGDFISRSHSAYAAATAIASVLPFILSTSVSPVVPIPAIPVIPIPDIPILLNSAVEASNFPLHLDAVRVLVRMLKNNPSLGHPQLPDVPDPLSLLPGNDVGLESDPTILNLAAETIWAKQSWNPFFELLYRGPTHAVYDHIINACPDPREAHDASAPELETQWMWEVPESSPAHDKKFSMGWDCVFIGHLYNEMRVPDYLAAELFDKIKKMTDPLDQFLTTQRALLQTTRDALQRAKDALEIIKASVARDIEAQEKLLLAPENAISGLTGSLRGPESRIVNLVAEFSGLGCRKVASLLGQTMWFPGPHCGEIDRAKTDAQNAINQLNGQIQQQTALVNQINARIKKTQDRLVDQSTMAIEHRIDDLEKQIDILLAKIAQMQNQYDKLTSARNLLHG